MIYLLNATGLSPGGSTHLHTKTIHRTTQITTEQHKIQTNVEECGPCPVFASFTFALQLRKKHGKTSVRVGKTLVKVQYTYYQNTHTYTHTHTRTHAYYKTVQNHHSTDLFGYVGKNVRLWKNTVFKYVAS